MSVLLCTQLYFSGGTSACYRINSPGNYNFTGSGFGFGSGSGSFSTIPFPSDQLNSLQVSAGYVVTLFSDYNGQGQSQTFVGPVQTPDVFASGFPRNTAKSISVVLNVAICELPEYQGRCLTIIAPGRYNFGQAYGAAESGFSTLRYPNRSLNSLRVGPDYTVTLYTLPNGLGESRTYPGPVDLASFNLPAAQGFPPSAAQSMVITPGSQPVPVNTATIPGPSTFNRLNITQPTTNIPTVTAIPTGVTDISTPPIRSQFVNVTGSSTVATICSGPDFTGGCQDIPQVGRYNIGSSPFQNIPGYVTFRFNSTAFSSLRVTAGHTATVYAGYNGQGATETFTGPISVSNLQNSTTGFPNGAASIVIMRTPVSNPYYNSYFTPVRTYQESGMNWFWVILLIILIIIVVWIFYKNSCGTCKKVNT